MTEKHDFLGCVLAMREQRVYACRPNRRGRMIGLAGMANVIALVLLIKHTNGQKTGR